MEELFVRTRIKFCGMDSPAAAEEAVALGVDGIGLIFAESPRRITVERARAVAAVVPPFVTLFGVFTDPDDVTYAAVAAAIPRMIPQFCGDESPQRCETLARGPYCKVVHVVAPQDGAAADASQAAALMEAAAAYAPALPVFDTKIAGRGGGSGTVFDWNVLPHRLRYFAVAGGLTPLNVAECVQAVRPYAVDVRSGIETNGRKDREKMRAFVAAVRRADEERRHGT